MRLNPIVVTLVASALIAAPAAAIAQGNGTRDGATDSQKRAQVERSQRDLDRDRLRSQDRDRTQDRIHAPDDAKQAQARMYGYGLMTDEEREAYNARLMKAKNAEEREQIKAQHRKEIQERARERNVDLDENGDPVPEE